jgi:hypothetical protein
MARRARVDATVTIRLLIEQNENKTGLSTPVLWRLVAPPYWRLVARIRVFPWLLVAHSNI